MSIQYKRKFQWVLPILLLVAMSSCFLYTIYAIIWDYQRGQRGLYNIISNIGPRKVESSIPQQFSNEFWIGYTSLRSSNLEGNISALVKIGTNKIWLVDTNYTRVKTNLFYDYRVMLFINGERYRGFNVDATKEPPSVFFGDSAVIIYGGTTQYMTPTIINHIPPSTN